MVTGECPVARKHWEHELVTTQTIELVLPSRQNSFTFKLGRGIITPRTFKMNIVRFGLVPELELDGKEDSFGFKKDRKYYIGIGTFLFK